MKPKLYPSSENIKVPKFEEAAGFYTTTEKSKQMSKIRAKNTKPETMFRKALHTQGIRFRNHSKGIPGNPDVAIKKYKLAVFIDGEFWHGYDWLAKKDKIKTNRDFWVPKIERNMQRDEQVNEHLKALGFTVFRFWDFEIKQNLTKCVGEIIGYLLRNRTWQRNGLRFENDID